MRNQAKPFLRNAVILTTALAVVGLLMNSWGVAQILIMALLAVLTAGQLRIYDNTMHLYAHTDNDAGATNVVQRTDGTVILLGSGRAERYVP